MYDGVQVFSATLARDRETLGDHVTDWLADNDVEVVEVLTRQSSDAEYHCTTIVLFYKRK